ncbi:MAG TPA: glutamine--tRNA ligase, partial [Paludibacteraceae bacterium]|nr:glutamine--tRNA ligase [Paludibacteraceae bacterium]
DRLFDVENPGDEKDRDFREMLNPDSLKVVNGFVEPWLKDVKPFDHFQFQRIGYFNVDPDTKEGKLVFNRTVPLKDSWAKELKKG